MKTAAEAGSELLPTSDALSSLEDGGSQGMTNISIEGSNITLLAGEHSKSLPIYIGNGLKEIETQRKELDVK